MLMQSSTDVLKGRISGYGATTWSKTELDAIEAQWNALPTMLVTQVCCFQLMLVARSIPIAGKKGTTICQNRS
jgi:hypothetical protein